MFLLLLSPMAWPQQTTQTTAKGYLPTDDRKRLRVDA